MPIFVTITEDFLGEITVANKRIDQFVMRDHSDTHKVVDATGNIFNTIHIPNDKVQLIETAIKNAVGKEFVNIVIEWSSGSSNVGCTIHTVNKSLGGRNMPRKTAYTVKKLEANVETWNQYLAEDGVPHRFSIGSAYAYTELYIAPDGNPNNGIKRIEVGTPEECMYAMQEHYLSNIDKYKAETKEKV